MEVFFSEALGHRQYEDYSFLVTHPDSRLVPVDIDTILFNLCGEDCIPEDLSSVCLTLRTMQPAAAMVMYEQERNVPRMEIVRRYLRWKTETLPILVKRAAVYWNALTMPTTNSNHKLIVLPSVLKPFVELAELSNSKTIALTLLDYNKLSDDVSCKMLMLMIVLRFCHVRTKQEWEYRENPEGFPHPEEFNHPLENFPLPHLEEFPHEEIPLEFPSAGFFCMYKRIVESLFKFIKMLSVNFTIRPSIRGRGTVANRYDQRRLRDWWLGGCGLVVPSKLKSVCKCYLFYYFAGTEKAFSTNLTLNIERNNV